MYGRNTHPFETSVNHMEAMHVFQAVRNINQLNSTSVRHLCGWVTRATYKLSTIHIFVLLDKLVDVPIPHPLGDHCKPVFAYRHPKQW
jgi:hypothetical protein